MEKDLNEQWISEVYVNSKEVDEHNQEDWHSLCLGWAIGKGLSIQEAKDFTKEAQL